MNKKRETALVITRNLPPLIGGMERLVWHIVDALAKEYRVHVIGPEGCAALLPADATASETPITPLWWFLVRTKWNALFQALRLRPKLVFAGSGLTAPFAWLAARLTGAKCVVYLHGLDIEAQNLAYRLLWRPFFKYFDLVLVNSRFTHGLAREAGVSEQKIKVLHPGVELPDTRLATQQRADFRVQYKLNDAPVLLYVGRITARKGLALFVRDILPSIIQYRPETRLVIIGDEPSGALQHRQGELNRVHKAVEEKGLGERTLILRKANDSTLQAAYFAADVLIFPVREIPGDHEGFGMVAIEAAAHGLPTVAFAAGGVTDAVAEGVSGNLVPPNDNNAFASRVIEMLQHPLSEQSIHDYAVGFSWNHFGKQMRDILDMNIVPVKKTHS